MNENSPDMWEERQAVIHSRLLELEAQVATLTARVDELSLDTKLESPVPVDDVSTAQSGESLISPGMIEVISLIHQGRGDDAQRELYALPEEELAGQPAIVALAAAALCAQREDYSTALTALNRARQLTDDPRLLKVIQLVETQVS